MAVYEDASLRQNRMPGMQEKILMVATMKPPVRSIVLPDEVCELLNAALTGELTGMFALHIVKGEIRKYEMRDVRTVGKR